MITAWHAILHWLGIDYGLPYGHWGFYSFWSGVAGSFLIGAAVWLAVWYPHHTCHVKGCWRWGKHEAAGGMFRLCWAHHPDMGQRPHPEMIHRLHREWQGTGTRQGGQT